MKEYADDELLQLSGLQHFLFCRRQWALIHVETQWAENFRTVDGELMHQRAHDGGQREKRGDILITRGMAICSRRLGVSGKCDVLEFHRSDDGVAIPAIGEGKWLPFPVEYKRGEPKSGNFDAAQLCGQAMCLEEMLCCEIKKGALLYGETRRRLPVEFSPELRGQVCAALEEMHELARRGYTPKVRPSKACKACSLSELCIPTLMKTKPVKEYLEESL